MDLPSRFGVPVELMREVDEWGDRHGINASRVLCPAPGTEVLGSGAWVVHQRLSRCENGHEMPLLFTVADREFEADNRLSWQPVEEQGFPRKDRDPFKSDLDIGVSDEGSLYIFVCQFVCQQCDDRRRPLLCQADVAPDYHHGPPAGWIRLGGTQG